MSDEGTAEDAMTEQPLTSVGPRRLEDLPRFGAIRLDAYRALVAVQDSLGSGCHPDGLPTPRQKAAVGRALRAIDAAKAALQEAVYR